MADIAKQFARLVANYGDSKIRGAGQQGLLMHEWGEGLCAYSPEILHKAVGKCIQTSEFWPTVAVVLGHAKTLHAETADIHDRETGKGYHRAADDEDRAPLTPDEVERRKDAWELAKSAARQKIPFAPSLEYSMPSELETERKPLPPADPVAEADSIERIKRSLGRAR